MGDQVWPGKKVQVRRSFNTTTVREQHPWSHLKGATDANATGGKYCVQLRPTWPPNLHCYCSMHVVRGVLLLSAALRLACLAWLAHLLVWSCPPGATLANCLAGFSREPWGPSRCTRTGYLACALTEPAGWSNATTDSTTRLVVPAASLNQSSSKHWHSLFQPFSRSMFCQTARLMIPWYLSLMTWVVPAPLLCELNLLGVALGIRWVNEDVKFVNFSFDLVKEIWL